MAWRKLKNIGITEATKKLGISPERLRYWEVKSLICPAYEGVGAKVIRRYSTSDIEIGLEILKMLNDGYTLKGAAQRLNLPYKGD